MSENMLKKNIVTNAKIAIFSQLAILLIGFVKSLVIPGLLSVEDYGYWQIYLLYLPYIGLFYWGFNDGIYLKYGGYKFRELPSGKIRSSIRYFFLMLLIESIILFLISPFFFSTIEYKIMQYVVLNICVQGIYGTIIYILQITNQIKEFSFFSVIDKILFVLYLLSFLFVKSQSYINLIRADLGSRIIVTIIMIFRNKVLFIGSVESAKNGLIEFISNIRTGISLMFASFISLLFSGAGRIFIANTTEISKYAYYSFGMSLINLLLVCFSSISTVLYPILKRMNSKSYARQYDLLTYYFEILCVIGLMGYYICYFFVVFIYKNYSPVLEYLNLLFILAIFQGRITLLNNTFYKVLRREKKMLFDNFLSLSLFLGACFLFCDTVYKIAITTCIIMAHRSIDTELYFRKKMNILNNNRFKYLSMTIFFFFFSSILPVPLGLSIYFIFVISYLVLNKTGFINLIKLFINKA